MEERGFEKPEVPGSTPGLATLCRTQEADHPPRAVIDQKCPGRTLDLSFAPIGVFLSLLLLLTFEIGAAMINGVSTTHSVRLKVPAHWQAHISPATKEAVRASQTVLQGPPLYTPHPDTLLRLWRCLWCLTRVDPAVPVKFRKCPRCGKQGQTTFPLYSNLMFVEYF